MHCYSLCPDISVSSFCYGVMPWSAGMSEAEMDRLMGVFRDAGGNVVDTAHCYAFWTPYGAGASECALGDYLKRHGCRDELVIGTKGAHPPVPRYRACEHFMSPERIAADIDDSLGRMRIDTIDLYWLHRDDPRVPAGEIVEWLNDEVIRGRIRCFGGSNWSAARLAEANVHADAHGLMGMVASQPSWNLAHREPFGNDQRVLSPEDAVWHTASQVAVMPYSPTAQGFFATSGDRGGAYQNPTARARLARAQRLAAELGCTPNQIALAWLRHQPFPVIPILGTTHPEHLSDALGAEPVSLTAEQVAWLASDDAN